MIHVSLYKYKSVNITIFYNILEIFLVPKTEEIHKLIKDLLDEYDKIFNEVTEDNIPKKKKKKCKKINKVIELTTLSKNQKKD